MIVALVSTATVTIAFSAYEVTSAKSEQLKGVKSLSKMLSPNITTALMFDDTDAIQELINPLLIRTDIVSVTVKNSQGQELAIAVSSNQNDINDHGVEVITPLTLDAEKYGELIIRSNNSYVNDRNAFYIKFSIALLLFTFVISLVLSLLLRRRFLNPILSLARTAENITSFNDYSLRAKHYSTDEVGQLTDCFNDMLHTIEQREISLENQVQLRTKELENANSQLYKYAYRDGLTELPNRRYFYKKIQSLINTKNMKFTLIFIDLDGFKEVNDNLGHDFGDLLLREVAERLQSCLRKSDTVARLGGDEFTLILEGVDDHARALEIADKVKVSLNECINIKKEQVYITGSLGITFFPADGSTVDVMVKRADQAMYLSKKKGRNCCEFFSYEIEKKAFKERRLLEEVRIALNEEQFELYYQPIFSIDGKTVNKAEALIRWNHPERGIIFADDFIHIAEKNGLITDIGQWVKSQVIQDTIGFNELRDTPLQISVNTSPLEIDHAGKWVEQWIEASDKYGIPAHTVLIEVTENTLMDPDSIIQSQLKQLQANNIDIAIDDFGVGYSSLAYLQRLDINILKIDRSFIFGIEDNESSTALIKAIITMAHNLAIKVVAEGVETPGQYLLLKQLGCDYIQGFYFAEPLPKNDFIAEYIKPVEPDSPSS